MSESGEEVRGPVMLAMTTALRPPPARISRIGDNVTLPVALQLNQLIAGGIGGFVGLLAVIMFWVPFFGFSIPSGGIGLIGGVFAGILFVTWSPIKGESFSKWLGLSIGTFRGNKVVIDGEPARAYIGIAKLESSAAGVIRVYPGAVEVPAGSVDERGVIIPLSELRQAQSDRLELANRLRMPGIEDGFDPVRPELSNSEEPEPKSNRWSSRSS
jgi:hypothetical protein